MKASRNVTLKERKTITLNNLRGVDYSSSPLNVPINRASDMLNFINEYGVTRKRNGWNQLFRFAGRINGIFEYISGERKEIIVYAGTAFYRIIGTTKERIMDSCTYAPAQLDTALLKDQRIQAFFSKGKMYIVGCGDFLVYGNWKKEGETEDKFELRRVYNNEDTYIPTTTISIDNNLIADDIRANLDDINILTNKRKNQMLGFSEYLLTRDKVFKPDKKYYTKQGRAFIESSVEAGKDVPSDTYYEKTASVGACLTRDKFFIENKQYFYLFNKEDLDGISSIYKGAVAGKDYQIGEEVPAGKFYTLCLSSGEMESYTWTVDSGKIDDKSKVLVSIESVSNGESLADIKAEEDTLVNEFDLYEQYNPDKKRLYSLKDIEKGDYQTPKGEIDFENGYITLYAIEGFNITPRIEGRDNIFVTFQYTNPDYTNRIGECNFGVLFGVDGNTDRLFLAGNSKFPNIDFHSEMDDFTYFSDLNTASMGSESTALKGYARLSDSTLVIYKESNGQEASIFYRTGKYQESYNKSGELESIRGVFPTTAGSIGEGVISRYACANFAGDSIILSQNGVYGIVLGSNVATNERYARERSRFINEKLTRHDGLSDAVGIVYKNRYYLAVDGLCYVADQRYKFIPQDTVDNAYNYEWWIWDNIPARVWANIGNELYFGTDDGRICAFDEDYIDRTFEEHSNGLSLNISGHCISCSPSVRANLVIDDKIIFTAGELYALLADDTLINSRYVIVSESNIKNIHEGMEVYVDNVGEPSPSDIISGKTGLSVDKKYIIGEVNREECCFVLKDMSGKIIVPLHAGFRIFSYITGKEVYVASITNSLLRVKEYKEGDFLRLERYNDTTPTELGIKHIKAKNIVAKWYTPIMDLGTNEASKTLLKMTIAAEPRETGKMLFGYETKKLNHFSTIRTLKNVGAFSFEDFSFEDFSFDTGFASSYTTRVNERNFNYIMFRFISEDDKCCTLNSFSATYKINKTNRGIK